MCISTEKESSVETADETSKSEVETGLVKVSASKRPPLNFEPADVFVNHKAKPPEWIWDQTLAAGCMTLLAGPPKSGKSLFARNLLREVSEGRPFLGIPTRRSTVAYVALEEHDSFLQAQFKNMSMDKESVLVHCGPVNGSVEDLFKCIREHVEMYQTKFIVIDPIAKFLNIEDLNDYSEVYKKLSPLSEFARHLNVHFLLIHHSNKSGTSGANQILGSTGIFAVSDGALLISRNGNLGTIKSNMRYGKPLDAQFTYDEKDILIHQGTRSECAEDRLSEQILTSLEPESLSIEALVKRLSVTKARVVSALKQLEQSESISRSGRGTKGDPFIYSVLNSCSIGQKQKNHSDDKNEP